MVGFFLEFFGILKCEWVKVENRIFGDDVENYYEFLLLCCYWKIKLISFKFRKVSPLFLAFLCVSSFWISYTLNENVFLTSVMRTKRDPYNGKHVKYSSKTNRFFFVRMVKALKLEIFVQQIFCCNIVDKDCSFIVDMQSDKMIVELCLRSK